MCGLIIGKMDYSKATYEQNLRGRDHIVRVLGGEVRSWGFLAESGSVQSSSAVAAEWSDLMLFNDDGKIILKRMIYCIILYGMK